MSLLLFRPKTGAGAPVLFEEPDAPLVTARIAWRPIGEHPLTALPWDGSRPQDWVSDGSLVSGPATSLTSTISDSFGGGASLEMVTAGTAGSGVDYSLGTAAFVSGREYRFRVGLRSVSGSTSTLLRVGNATDYAEATATITTDWLWHTVDWTPGTAIADASVTIANAAAATQTTRFDHAEVYEALDDVVLQSLTISRGSNFDGGAERPGRLDFSILDPDEVYTPRNSASPLYGSVDTGKRVHIRATHNGRLYALGYGIVRGVTPDPETRTVAFTCEDGLFELDGYSVSQVFRFSDTFADSRAEALNSWDVGHSLALDSVEASTFADGTDEDEGLLDYLDGLNEATGTVHYCAPQLSANEPWQYTTITRATLTNDATDYVIDDDFQTLSDVSARDESVIERQRVSWVGYDPLPSQVIVEATAALPYWTYTDELFGSSETPQPENVYTIKRRVKIVKSIHREGKKEVKWKLRRHVRRRKRIGHRWVDSVLPLTFAADETKTLTLDFSVPMEELSVVTVDGGHISASIDSQPGRAVITLTADDVDTVTDIYVIGSPHLPSDEQTEEVTLSASAREAHRIDNERIASAGMAYGLAEYLTWRYGSGRLRPSVVDQHQIVRQLGIDVGTHVTLTADRWHIDGVRFVVRSIQHDVAQKGLDWRTTYGLEELPAGGDWFTLDGSSAQGLDSSATLAH